MTDVILFDAHIVPNLARELSNQVFQALAFDILFHIWLLHGFLTKQRQLCVGCLVPFGGQ